MTAKTPVPAPAETSAKQTRGESKDDRKARQAKALRANLKRRKAQARDREPDETAQ